MAVPLKANQPLANILVKKKYPETFIITKAEFEQLISANDKQNLRTKTNKYIDRSTVVMNKLTGDMRFVKIRLNYFPNANLTVQVNGEFSTQIFILSEDKSLSYKGKLVDGNVIMTKCDEDEIVSE